MPRVAYPVCAMPCTLPRLEVWQVAPRACQKCSKTPLPKSAKTKQHQACTELAISKALSHKVCRRRKAKFSKQPQVRSLHQELVKSKSKTIGARKKFVVGKKWKKKRMAESESDSGDSVIILSEEDDDLPTRLTLVDDFSDAAKKDNHRNNFVKTVEKKTEESSKENMTRPFHLREVSHGNNNKKPKDVEKKEAVKHRNNLIRTVGNKSEEPNKEKVKMRSSYRGEVTHNSNKASIESSPPIEGRESSDDDDRFEKHFKQDLNFVKAKFLAKKKLGFVVCDENANIDPVEKKLKKILLRADIMILKKSLDDGGNAFTPREVEKKKLLPKIPPPPDMSSTVTPQSSSHEPSSLSDDDSPNISQILPSIDTNVPQMPVVVTDDVKVLTVLEKGTAQNKLKEKSVSPRIKEAEKPPSRVLKLLKPAVVFPSFKIKTFKIPRAAKTKTPRWVTNGSLWRWALTVDDNGQYSRLESTRKKVAWASKVTSRLCDEDFQEWLVRGSFTEGDDCAWGEEEERERRRTDEVKRRREEMMWRENVLDKMMGKEPHVVAVVSTRDPLGLDEKDSGTGTMEVGIATSDGAASARDTIDDLSENELDVSQQSLVTHIRTPTHTFCMDEEDIKGAESKPLSPSIPAPLESNIARQCPTTFPPSVSSENIQPILSPPPSQVPNVGFAFTRVAASSHDIASASMSRDPGRSNPSKAPPSSQTAQFSQHESAMSTLFTARKARLQLF